MIAAFDVTESVVEDLPPSWKVAPMQGIPYIAERLHEGELVRRLEVARWGLVPIWWEDPKAGGQLINARSETVTEKPSFGAAAAKRQALIPANGHYEWQKSVDGTKIPHRFHGQDEDQLLGFADLYEYWSDPTKEEDAPDKWLVTAAILTTQVDDALEEIHERSPVIILKDLHGQWLDPSMTDKADMQHFINAMALAWLVVLSVAAGAIGFRLVAILRRVPQDTP
jgi:putative SOS response-associated peptidase YedK